MNSNNFNNFINNNQQQPSNTPSPMIQAASDGTFEEVKMSAPSASGI
jgi:hypothetical protein